MQVLRISLAWIVVVAACGSPKDNNGGGDGGSNNTGGSAGCGKSTSLEPGSYVEQSIDVGGARQYYVRVPVGYDNKKKYPIVYLLHGCSDSADRQNNVPPLEKSGGDAAIYVRGRAAANCWETNATKSDVAYIDALLPDVEGKLCVDESKRFLAGYSSGSFMTHQLACIRGALFRAVATIAGGQSGSSCTGDPAALLIHDTDDGTVNISASIGARDNHLTRNHCSMNKAGTMPSPCEAYTGCDAGKDVVWCQTSGQNHSRQDSLSGPAFWAFFDRFL